VATTVFGDRDVDVSPHVVPRAGGTLIVCRSEWIWTVGVKIGARNEGK
jgi:hypothetical protein